MLTIDEWLDDVPRNVVKYPSRILRDENHLITTFDDKLKQLVNEMFAIMYDFKGVGLSSPQVGLNLKLFILNATGNPENPEQEKVFINPEVISYGIRKVESKEGCLSLPGVYGTIERSRRFLFSAYDLNGKKQKYAFEGMISKVCSHEFDHLSGILITDLMKKEELKLYESILLKLEQQALIPF